MKATIKYHQKHIEQNFKYSLWKAVSITWSDGGICNTFLKLSFEKGKKNEVCHSDISTMIVYYFIFMRHVIQSWNWRKSSNVLLKFSDRLFFQFQSISLFICNHRSWQRCTSKDKFGPLFFVLSTNMVSAEYRTSPIHFNSVVSRL